MGINAVKVEIGEGFRVVKMRGSEHRDEISSSGFLGNSAGGILGAFFWARYYCKHSFKTYLKYYHSRANNRQER